MRDLDWITLKGTLGIWVAEYHMLVTGAVDFLVGWITVSWIEISDTESHLVVILIVLWSSFLKSDTVDTELPSMVVSILIVMLALIAIVLLLPGQLGIAVAVALCSFTLLQLFEDSPRFPRRLALMNLSGVVGTALLIILGSVLIR